MKLRKIAVLGMGCVLSLTLTAGAVYAATGTSSDVQPNPKGGAAIAQILGLDSQSFGQELKSGKTLAQIAAAKGIDANTLTQKLQSALNDRIDKAVASGKLTADKAEQIKAKEDSEIIQKINQPWTGEKGKCGFDKGMGQTLQSVLGLNATQLKEQFKSGKTLAQIAVDKGISKAALSAKLQAAMESKIDQAVTHKKLTSDQAAQIKAKLPERIDRMINQTHVKK